MSDTTRPAGRPAVSVCIPVYNKAAYVGDTIASVLAQTFTNFELVVVDNASTDGSAAVIDAFDDPRIVVVRNQTTVPMVENFTLAASHAEAPLVKLLCADDLLHPECLERQVEAFALSPDVTIVGCRQDLIDATGAVLARGLGLRGHGLVGIRSGSSVIRRIVRHGGNPVGSNNCLLLRRDAFETAGELAGGEGYTLDLLMCVRLCSQGRFVGIPESLVSFRAPSSRNDPTPREVWFEAQRRFTRKTALEHRACVRRGDELIGAARAQLARLRYGGA